MISYQPLVSCVTRVAESPALPALSSPAQLSLDKELSSNNCQHSTHLALSTASYRRPASLTACTIAMYSDFQPAHCAVSTWLRAMAAVWGEAGSRERESSPPVLTQLPLLTSQPGNLDTNIRPAADSVSHLQPRSGLTGVRTRVFPSRADSRPAQ